MGEGGLWGRTIIRPITDTDQYESRKHGLNSGSRGLDRGEIALNCWIGGPILRQSYILITSIRPLFTLRIWPYISSRLRLLIV